MSRILITGGNGFVARNLIKGLQEHELTILTRSEFDLRDTDAVDKFFKNKSFDFVLHTATSGGSRLKSDDSDVLLDNLIMFYNLLKHKSKYRKFINFGSGAEMDRRTDINLIYPDYKKSFPIDPYGLSKNIIARLIEPLPDFHSIRIFNVFGEDELDVKLDNNALIVSGSRVREEMLNYEYLHRGLSSRDFTQTFPLAEHVEVIHAEVKNGILFIFLERKVPEEKKPKSIAITYTK
jgi:nucleoside-diphosphate-sugar epimerase